MILGNIDSIFEANDKIAEVIEKNNSHWSTKQYKNILYSILYRKYIILYRNLKKVSKKQEEDVLKSIIGLIINFLEQIKSAENIDQIREAYSKYRPEYFKNVGELSNLRQNNSSVLTHYHNKYNTPYEFVDDPIDYSFIDRIFAGDRKNVNLYIGESTIYNVNAYFGMIRKFLHEWKSKRTAEITPYFHMDSNNFSKDFVPEFLRGKMIISKEKDVKIYPRFDISFNINNGSWYNESILRSYKHTRPNGIGVFITEYGHLNNETIPTFLAYWTDLSVQKICDELVVVIGKKKASKSVESTSNRGYLDFIEKIINAIQNRTINNEEYKVENTPLEIIFKGFNITEEEIAEFIENNKKNIKRNTHLVNTKLCNNDILGFKNPLMPFSPGQLGLALVSGYIDGVVEDGDAPHIIKGTVETHNTYLTEQIDENTTHSHATTRNSTSIVMLLGNGQFRTLM